MISTLTTTALLSNPLLAVASYPGADNPSLFHVIVWVVLIAALLAALVRTVDAAFRRPEPAAARPLPPARPLLRTAYPPAPWATRIALRARA